MKTVSPQLNQRSLISQFISKNNLLLSSKPSRKSSFKNLDTKLKEGRDSLISKNHFAFIHDSVEHKRNRNNQGGGNSFNQDEHEGEYKLPANLTIRDAKNALPLTDISNTLFGAVLRVGQEARTYIDIRAEVAGYKGMRNPLKSKHRNFRVYQNSLSAIKENSKPLWYSNTLVMST